MVCDMSILAHKNYQKTITTTPDGQMFYKVYQAGEGEPAGHVNNCMEGGSIEKRLYLSIRNNKYIKSFYMWINRIKSMLTRWNKELER